MGQTASALLGMLEERGGSGSREAVRVVRGGLDKVREMAVVAAAAAGDWRRALLLLREQEATLGGGGGEEERMDVLTRYAFAVEACARAGRTAEAVALLEGKTLAKSTSGRKGEWVLSRVLEALGASGHETAALDVAKRALRGRMGGGGGGGGDGGATGSSSSSSLSALRSQRLKLLQQEKEEARRQRQDLASSSSSSSSSPSTLQQQHQLSRPAWQTLLRAAKGKASSSSSSLTHSQHDEALWVLHAMLEAGVPPSKGDLDWAVQALAGARQWEAVSSLLEKAAAAANGGGGGLMDVIGCNRLLHAMGREGEATRPLAFLRFMQERLGVRPDVVSFTSVMDACGKAGDWQGALRLLEGMEKDAKHNPSSSSSPRPNLRTYTVGMRACARAGEWQRCLALLERMEQAPDTIACNVALEACARAHQPQPALALLEEMERGELGDRALPDLVSYTNAIRAQEGGKNGGSAATARQLLKRFKAQGGGSMRPDVLLYNSALRVCVQEKQWRLAHEILGEMQRDGLAPDDLTVRALTRGGGGGGGEGGGGGGRERAQALALLRTMQDAAATGLGGGGRKGQFLGKPGKRRMKAAV